MIAVGTRVKFQNHTAYRKGVVEEATEGGYEVRDADSGTLVFRREETLLPAEEVIVWRVDGDGQRLYLTKISWAVEWSLVRKNARRFAHENAAYSYMVGRVAPSILKLVEYEEVAV